MCVLCVQYANKQMYHLTSDERENKVGAASASLVTKDIFGQVTFEQRFGGKRGISQDNVWGRSGAGRGRGVQMPCPAAFTGEV